MPQPGYSRELFSGSCREFCCCGCNQSRLFLEHLCNAGSSFFRFFPLLRLQTCPHGGNRLRGVTGVLAGSVELVLVPEAPRKTFRRSQLALALNEYFVDLVDRRGRQRGATIRAQTVERFL